MRKKRLLWQLYPSYLVITLLSLAAVTMYGSSQLRQFYIDRTGEDLESRAVLAAEPILPLLARQDFAAIDALCKQLGEKSDTRLTVIEPEGKVVGDTLESPARMDNHADRPEVIEALRGEAGRSLRYSNTLKEPMRYVAVPLRHDGRIVGVVRATLSLAAIDHALATIRLHIALGSLLVAAILAGLTLVLARRITRPLEQLQRGAERFAQGDLSGQLSVADSLEIGSLAETLNRMAAQLDAKMRAVVQQRNEQEAILSSMVEGVLAVDADQRLLRFNRAAARLISIDPARAEGRTLPEVVRNPELHRLVGGVLATHEPVVGEVVLRDSGERYLHVHGTVLRDARQHPVGALVVFHDVTELKNLERIRRDFVANVSHELRTPVTSIKGYVETLLDGAMHNPEELQRFLTIVATQTDRLNAIFEDLLMLSRIEQEAENAKVVLSPGSVCEMLTAAIEGVSLTAAEKRIRLELRCDESLQADMNRPLLEQAVINLIDNAIKYSAEEKPVAIEAERVETEIVIRVRDQGCGISREHHARIFERFYRVDKSRSRKLGGTGLGLAIVKHIAQAHGGRATVESTPGQGSTFSIHLPRHAAPAE